MKNFIIAFRTFFKQGQSSGIKVVSLGAGLAMGLILISKVYFEQSYDNFYPDKDRSYKVSGVYAIGEAAPKEYGTISGGVVVGMKNEIPSIEAATRYTELGDNLMFYTPDKAKYEANFILADSCLFDVLALDIISGNAKQTLSRPMYVMVSEKIAKAIGKGDDPIGQNFTIEDYPNRSLTIGGIFANIPENSHTKYDVVLSLNSISAFMGDGSNDWIGNERYNGYIKLINGATPESIESDIIALQNKYQDPEEMKKYGLNVRYNLVPLDKVHDIGENKSSIMLGLLAFTLLFTAIMNYILIVISSMVKRNREIAVYKCYGASAGNITNRILSETFISLIVSLIISISLIILFSGTIEDILQTQISSLFSGVCIVILLTVCVLVFFITGIIPSYIFSRIPISSAFKHHVETRRHWKQALLFFQFLMASFLISLLFVVIKQYDLMINNDLRYTYDKTLYVNTSGVQLAQQSKAIERIKTIRGVTNVATANTLPIFAGSGNMVSEIGSEVSLFNFVDLYGVDADYIPLMEIKIREGRAFSLEQADSTSAIVSRSFSDKICNQLNWSDGVIGKTLSFSEHGNSTIVGVYDDIKFGSLAQVDERPTMMFYQKQARDYILIKLDEIEPDKLSEISNILQDVFPEKSIQIKPYKTEIVNMYADSLRFSNSVLIGGIIVFIISMMGLIGYTNDEIIRRSKEIAVRKINGSTAESIIFMLSKSICYMAVPAIIFGGICSYIVGEIWLKQFSDKILMSTEIVICLGASLLVFIIIISCVVFKTWSVANENPVKRLKNE